MARILTSANHAIHGAMRRNRISKAGPGVLLILLACADRAPPNAVPPDTSVDTAPAIAADTLDTYVEGSERVWNAARGRGVVFRAVGQEPGWVLEIERTGAVLLLTDHGQDTVRAALPPADVERAVRAATLIASTDAGTELHVDIRETSCTDTMSGERFSRSVVVTLNGDQYIGCGRSLEPPV